MTKTSAEIVLSLLQVLLSRQERCSITYFLFILVLTLLGHNYRKSQALVITSLSDFDELLFGNAD